MPPSKGHLHGDPLPIDTHTIDGGIVKPFQRHRDADRRRESAITAAKAILGLDLYDAHKRQLLRTCIWKLTEAEADHKHRTRYRTRAALESNDVEHEHVVQQSTLVEALLVHPAAADELLACAVACTVTAAEHRELSRISRERPELEGWHRYLEISRGGTLLVIDTKDGSEVNLEDLAVRHSHPLLNEMRDRPVPRSDLRELFDQFGIMYEVDASDHIKENSVLRHGEASLQLYFRERGRRQSFFEANAKRYARFTWEHWTFLGSEPDGAAAYVKVVPCIDYESEALEGLLRFIRSER